jgi:hypothetical protein
MWMRSWLATIVPSAAFAAALIVGESCGTSSHGTSAQTDAGPDGPMSDARIPSKEVGTDVEARTDGPSLHDGEAGPGLGAVIPQDFFGVHLAVSHTSIDNPPPYGTPVLAPVVVGALGKGVGTLWQVLEPVSGTFDWTDSDHFVNWAKGHGVTYFNSWDYMPYWALGITDPASRLNASTLPTCGSSDFTYDGSAIEYCYGTPTDAGETEWIAFNTAMATRYAGMGVIFEGWNEPPYAPGTGEAPTLPTSVLVQMETDRLNAIRAADPTAKVCSEAFIISASYPSYSTYMDDFFKSGGPKTYDCYDFHINYLNEPEDEIPLIAQYKGILSANGITPPVIYATENGRGGSGVTDSYETCPGWPTNLTEDQIQAFVARMELTYWSQGIARHYWYAYDTCGTLTNQPTTSTLTAAGTAYGNVETWMVGAVMTSPCATSDGGTVWTCTLARATPAGYEALVVWDTAGSSSYTPSTKYKQYKDLTGGTHTISPPGSAVTIGIMPLMFENQ